ncbi:MAG TPA: acetyl-CoA carboxylase, carboxyltransferase subunit beta [Thermoanaerobaculia bacterium]|nr:acetyl-CoA carboxylase, carboxyltransferase subunit beta [Thermoanaerobaculia bacterium]
MAWFKKDKKPKAVRPKARSSVPEGLWTRCQRCSEIVYSKELERNARICPKCGYHFRLTVSERVELLLDPGSRELWADLAPCDPLGFADTKPYTDRLAGYQKRTGRPDAVRVVDGTIDSQRVVLAAMDYEFMGGSMGSVVGEKISRAIEHAIAAKTPLLIVCASGGARMQEGALSLMQMAKISAALAELREARLPYLSILTDPTTGGVTASFAMLGDLNIAEPGALIGFAGPRVIEQTIRETLPDGFQTSEFLLEHGFLDLVVPRNALRETVARCLRHLT